MTDARTSRGRASGDPRAWRRAVAEVWAGATRASLAGVGGIALFAAAQLLAISLWVTPAAVARMDPGLLMYGPHDFDPPAMVAALRLAHLPHPEPGVVFVTTSSGRHAIADEESAGEQIAARSGEPVRFHLVASGLQSLWQVTQILDQIPADFRGAAVVSVGPSRFSRVRETLEEEVRWPRLALDSPWLREEIERAGLRPTRRLGVYFLDQGRFFASRRREVLTNLLFGAPTYQMHRFAFPKRASEAAWQRRLPDFDRRMDDALGEGGELGLAVLERAITRLRERGAVRVALVESTRHPRILALYGERYPRYRARVSALAERLGVPYWDLDAEAGLEAEDFYDWTHLGSQEPRRRYQTALASRVATLLGDGRAGP